MRRSFCIGRNGDSLVGGRIPFDGSVLPAIRELRHNISTIYSQQVKRRRAASRVTGGPPAVGSVIFRASASIPSCTPASYTFGVSGHADTINSCPANSAPSNDLRDHALRLLDRGQRRCLYWRCDGEGQCSKSDQPDHPYLPCLQEEIFLKQWIVAPSDSTIVDPDQCWDVAAPVPYRQ
jgi:hypothetical protein